MSSKTPSKCKLTIWGGGEKKAREKELREAPRPPEGERNRDSK